MVASEGILLPLVRAWMSKKLESLGKITSISFDPLSLRTQSFTDVLVIHQWD